MRDTLARDALLLLLFFGMLALALAIALSWSRGTERTAYARGYAVAVDSVRVVARAAAAPTDTLRVVIQHGRALIIPDRWTRRQWVLYEVKP